jgi:SAM-dependent methyltransferase
MKPTERFTERVPDYVAVRPSYPDEAIDALFDGLGDPAAVTVVDLGAGTGIASRLLAARGAQVLAVEPNAAMRAAAEPHPRVTWFDGSAERTGLEEAVADLVTAFQAFHWLAFEPAMEETIRLLRPGGRAALVYYERDDADRFTAAYGDLVRRYATDDTERRRAIARERFAQFPAWHTFRRIVIPHANVLDREGLHTYARSASYLPREGSTAEALHAELDRLADAHLREGRAAMVLRTIVLIGDVGADGA